VLTEAEWLAHAPGWLPSDGDRAYLQAISGAVTEPGKYAHWIAPPPRGINNQAADFAYVRFH
jgi:benzoyl-CoA 2,3-dioxygenase component B